MKIEYAVLKGKPLWNISLGDLCKWESKNIYLVVIQCDVMGWINVVQNETQWWQL
jgi:hypothetical protein